jgi:hypothetical protein
METLKGIGLWLAGLAATAAILFVVFTGVAYVSGVVMPWLATAAQWLFAFALVVLLPATFFRPTRIAAVVGLLVASFVFGLCAWIFGFLITYTYWGVFGVLVGLMFAGIGVVPVGFLAAIFHGQWIAVWILFQYVALAIGCRIAMAIAAAKADRDQEERNLVAIQSK